MSNYEKTCLIRGDGGRAIRGILDRIGDKASPAAAQCRRFAEPLARGDPTVFAYQL